MMATQTNVWKTHIYYSQGKFIASALVHLKCGLVKSAHVYQAESWLID